MTRRRIIALILLLVSLITFVIIWYLHREEEPTVLRDKFNYASDVGFQFSIVYDGERGTSSSMAVSFLLNPMSPDFNPLYTELVFVLSEEDVVGFPDNVVVAWPCLRSRGGIIGMHLALSGNRRVSPHYSTRTLADEIDLEDFGLTYPLTFEQLVNDWENVAALISRLGIEVFHENIMGDLRHDALQRGRTIMYPDHPMLNYIHEMRFSFMSDADRLFVRCEETREEILIRELVFVHNREEALEVPREIATSWPREIPWLERRMAGINSVIHRTADELMHRDRQVRDVINLEDFGLIYPITIEDTVDNWEGVARLWDALSYYEHRDINIAAAEEY